ncbi:unnamed protein product [marine sediment metagenome]|uniref:Uncharacterized protein n=1 Tax=marine sediment metagenome TaxID=412755 RepID=X1VC99_9ZZZZ
MLTLKLNKGDPITLYDRTTHKKLGTISLSPNAHYKSIKLCFDLSHKVLILRAKAERNHNGKTKPKSTDALSNARLDLAASPQDPQR